MFIEFGSSRSASGRDDLGYGKQHFLDDLPDAVRFLERRARRQGDKKCTSALDRPKCLTLAALIAMYSFAAAGQSAGKPTESEVLLARAQEWVDTWNNRDAAKLREMHGTGLNAQLYGIGEKFGTVENLINDIERANWWGLSWSIKIVDPRVRKLGRDTGLVAFHLVGTESDSRGGSRVYSGAYSLILERKKKIWYITHVHSSHGPVPGSD